MITDVSLDLALCGKTMNTRDENEIKLKPEARKDCLLGA